MTQSFLLITNLLIPIVSGLFLLFYYLYFVFAHPGKTISFRLFSFFLIVFSAFLFSRPLQLLAGPYPMPLIIVNIRVFILCSVLSPVLILTALNFNKKITMREIIMVCAACLPLGIAYVLFNTLGTKDSFILFEFAGIAARDNLTPSLTSPWYGREVTIAVQSFTGVILLVFSIVRFIQVHKDSRQKNLFKEKYVLMYSGIIVFALSFILGSLARQWWVYYVTSIATALLIGGSVLIDIKELHTYYEKLIPYIKEEIMSSVSFSSLSKAKLAEMFECLGKKSDLNTFVLIHVKKTTYSSLEISTPTKNDVVEEILRWLESRMSEENFLLIPMEDDTVGLLLHVSRNSETNRQLYVPGIFDELREHISQTRGRELAAGIGRTYDDPSGLRLSWREASTALEYALQLKDCGIVHADNISSCDRRSVLYPIPEKDRLLAAVRSGDSSQTIEALGLFVPHFRRYVREHPDVLKIRLNELICSFVDSAIQGGGDESFLTGILSKYISEINRINDDADAEKWIGTVVREITGSVGKVYEKRTRSLIEKAKKYIEENCKKQISYKDAAHEIFISPSYFLNLFKTETGMTFVEYLTSIRIEKAKQMLMTTDMTITEIAYDLGFSNANYFSNIFRKAVGVSASEYRKPQ